MALLIENDDVIIIEEESTTSKDTISTIQYKFKRSHDKCNDSSEEIIFLEFKKQKGNDEELNQIVYEYARENPKIQIESGAIINCKSEVILNLVDEYLNSSLPYLYNIYGSDLEEKLKTYSLQFVPTESIYQIAITNHINNKYLNTVFNVRIDSYDYTSDKSEISFKSLIKNVLKLLNESTSCKSITLPVQYWTERAYPEYLLVKWFDESISDYLKSCTNHSIKSICILLDSIKNNKECFKNYYFIEKPSLLLLNPVSLMDKHDLNELKSESNEYLTVCKHFQLTLSHMKIERIVKVINPFLKNLYLNMKEAIKLKNPKNSTLEYKLFHGSSFEAIEKICKKGFNRSYCGKNGTSFGCGVYFAKESKYSHKYAIPKINKYCMILSSVIVGIYEKGNCFLKEPTNDNFDSTVDCIHSPNVFVVYKDFQAIPEYLIYYSFY